MKAVFQRGFVPFLIGLAIFSTRVGAQILPALEPETAALWRAVGVVNADGATGTATCTGTLVAPDLVLTAAHCAGGGNRQFLIGGIAAQMLSTHAAAGITINPAYQQAEGADRFAHDMALITLATSVPAAIATPLPLAPDITADHMAIVGFHRMRPGALNGSFECPVVDATPARLILGCQVIAGNSGAPALVETAAGWQIAGVVTARMDGAGVHNSLVAPVNDWLRAQVPQAPR
ncbi:MAG: trypsin-like serine protease [Sulfitobacter sp.]